MEGNSYQVRAATWKHTIVKQTVQSRILSDSKDLPIKFSPAKYADSQVSNTSRSLVRSKVMSRSHDEIAIKDLKVSSASKQKYVTKNSILQTPRQMNEAKINLKGLDSEESLNLKFDSPRRLAQFKKNSISSYSIDFGKDLKDIKEIKEIREIKNEFLKFKEKVLAELKKQEDSIKRSIHEIMLIISNTDKFTTRSAIQPIQPRPVPGIPQMPTLNSPHSTSRSLDKTNFPLPIHSDIKLRESSFADKGQIQSVLPLIKQRVNKMFDLMAQLKNQMNQQSLTPLNSDRRSIQTQLEQ